MMRVLIIASNDNSIDKIHNQLDTENHHILRINLHLKEEVPSLKIKDTNIIGIVLKNFHHMTIEIMDFQPEVVFYFPIKIDQVTDNNIEILDIIHVELVAHLIETLQVVNSKLYFINFIFNENLLKYLENNKINNPDLKYILEKRNKLIASNSKSFYLLTENTVGQFEIIIETITRYLKQ